MKKIADSRQGIRLVCHSLSNEPPYPLASVFVLIRKNSVYDDGGEALVGAPEIIYSNQKALR
jgi:hypothetical protein